MVGNRYKRSSNEEKPSFFKVIISGVSIDHLMRIPSKFLKHIHSEMSGRATLKMISSSDWSWPVRVIKTTNGVYFKNGWQEFLNDNCLGDSELLVFTYDGDMRFSIRIFDKSGSERNDDFSNSSTYEILNSANRKRPKGMPRKVHQENTGSSEPLEIKEEEEEANENTAAKDLATFKSKFPHFTKTKCKTGVMALPLPFSRKYLFPGKSEMYMLENSKGRTWEVKVHPPPSGNRYFFTAGWTDFVKHNQIEVGDACVFELVGMNKMVVNIFRGVRMM